MFLFFFNDTATTEIYTLSLHDALPILLACGVDRVVIGTAAVESPELVCDLAGHQDRKSTRLNSSHVEISYAVFCLKKKKNINQSGVECSVDVPVSPPRTINACHEPGAP